MDVAVSDVRAWLAQPQKSYDKDWILRHLQDSSVFSHAESSYNASKKLTAAFTHLDGKEKRIFAERLKDFLHTQPDMVLLGNSTSPGGLINKRTLENLVLLCRDLPEEYANELGSELRAMAQRLGNTRVDFLTITLRDTLEKIDKGAAAWSALVDPKGYNPSIIPSYRG